MSDENSSDKFLSFFTMFWKSREIEPLIGRSDEIWMSIFRKCEDSRSCMWELRLYTTSIGIDVRGHFPEKLLFDEKGNNILVVLRFECRSVRNNEGNTKNSLKRKEANQKPCNDLLERNHEGVIFPVIVLILSLE